MNAPTRSQLQILKLMHAGVELHPPTNAVSRPGARYRLVLGVSLAGMPTAKTVLQLHTNGWITFDGRRNRWVLTSEGRAQAEVKTFVGAFVESLAARSI